MEIYCFSLPPYKMCTKLLLVEEHSVPELYNVCGLGLLSVCEAMWKVRLILNRVHWGSSIGQDKGRLV